MLIGTNRESDSTLQCTMQFILFSQRAYSFHVFSNSFHLLIVYSGMLSTLAAWNVIALQCRRSSLVEYRAMPFGFAKFHSTLHASGLQLQDVHFRRRSKTCNVFAVKPVKRVISICRRSRRWTRKMTAQVAWPSSGSFKVPLLLISAQAFVMVSSPKSAP
jgi:hypothetical protein